VFLFAFYFEVSVFFTGDSPAFIGFRLTVPFQARFYELFRQEAVIVITCGQGGGGQKILSFQDPNHGLTEPLSKRAVIPFPSGMECLLGVDAAAFMCYNFLAVARLKVHGNRNVRRFSRGRAPPDRSA
jgi:hypothetical protein